MVFKNKLYCNLCRTEIDSKNENYSDKEGKVCICPKCLKEYKNFLRLDEENVFFKEGEYYTVTDQSSCEYINLLMGGFHDFMLSGISFENCGIELSENGRYNFKPEENKLTLRLIAFALTDSPVLEMVFTGVNGYLLSDGHGCSNDIFGAKVMFTAVRTGSNKSENMIVWSLDSDFDPQKEIGEQKSSCVAARSMKWKLLYNRN